MSFWLNGSANNVVGSTAVNFNSWNHVALVRSGSGSNNVKLYLNGVLEAQTTSTYNATADTIIVGRGYTNVNGEYTNGYISNLQMVVGTALYTANFTPPTSPLTAISGTSLLTCHSNRFVDSSTNAVAITANGTPSVQAFSPFLPTTAYSTSVVGGSGYFDGTGDYLTSASSANLAVGTGDFTYEFWLYPHAANSDNCIFDTRSANNNTSGFAFLIRSSANLEIYTNTANLVCNGAIKQSMWQHVALVRSGSTVTAYVNGVSVGSATFSNNLTDQTLSIASYVGAGSSISAYISGFRLVKGTAVYTATFTPPTSPATAITNTQILLSATNSGIFDSTAKNVYETFNTAAVSTAQAKWGTTSMVFNGTSDYIVNPSSALVSAWGTGDFTVEGWYYSNNIIGTPPLWLNSTSNSDGMSACYVYATGSVAFGKIGVNEITSATGVWSNSQWNHLAVVRSGATVYIYVNGVSVASGAAATYVETTTVKPITLGRNYQTASIYYNGYIDDFRVTKGYARYPSGTTFTPPAAAFPLQ
jgi:hypothetical protein